MPIVDWATHFWRSGPIDGAKELHHAERVARAGEHAGLDRTRGGRRVSRGSEPLNGIELLTSLVQMQLVLHAVQRCRVAVGIKLVIQGKDKTQRVLRMGESLKVPNAGSEVQNFAGAQRKRCFRGKHAASLAAALAGGIRRRVRGRARRSRGSFPRGGRGLR